MVRHSVDRYSACRGRAQDASGRGQRSAEPVGAGGEGRDGSVGDGAQKFNVDERRVYLMGHSMGGAGTLYLGSRYASNWAAIAAIAPAARRMESHMPSILAALTMPVLVVQ